MKETNKTLQYKSVRPIGANNGKFDSWMIQNDMLAIKHTDKSVFEHHGSGVPKDIRWFFEADELSVDERLDITLVYEDVEYKAYIKRETVLGRTRMFWYSNLNEKFNAYYKTTITFPLLMFEREGKARYKIKFLEDTTNKIIEPLDDSSSVEEKEAHAKTMDIVSLKAAAEKHSKNKLVEKIVQVKQVSRDPYIAEYAKQRANGVCQLCGQYAPFNDKKGRPYLESHHVVWLSEGGEDSIENTVALCPNCHKKMHVVADDADVATLLEKAKDILRD